MKTRLWILALALALLLVLSSVALANGPTLPRQALSSGASGSTATGLSLRATLGQPIIGLVSSSNGAETLGQGFWHGGSIPTPTNYNVYLPIVLRNH